MASVQIFAPITRSSTESHEGPAPFVEQDLIQCGGYLRGGGKAGPPFARNRVDSEVCAQPGTKHGPSSGIVAACSQRRQNSGLEIVAVLYECVKSGGGALGQWTSFAEFR